MFVHICMNINMENCYKVVKFFFAQDATESYIRNRDEIIPKKG